MKPTPGTFVSASPSSTSRSAFSLPSAVWAARSRSTSSVSDLRHVKKHRRNRGWEALHWQPNWLADGARSTPVQLTLHSEAALLDGRWRRQLTFHLSSSSGPCVVGPPLMLPSPGRGIVYTSV